MAVVVKSPDSWMIVAYGGLSVDELQVRISEKYRCLRIRNMPPFLKLSMAGIALLPQTDSGLSGEMRLTEVGYEKVGKFYEANGTAVWIYRRPEQWFQ